MSMLEIDHITHTYASGSGRPVLKDVNLTVEKGDVIALVGESGCGKTTLGRMIAGLYPPSSGTISYEGDDIATLRGRAQREWRRKVQLIHQDPYGSLNPGLTIGAALSPAMLKYGIATRRNVQDKMLELLRAVGLDATPDFLRRYPHQLSGGQRQRASIARSIALEPELVVADEVTSMLDVSMRVAILDLLLSFKESRGISFVFISHDFGVVRHFARGGRIAVMFFGVIVEEGPTEAVITTPRHPYTRMLLEAIPIPDPQMARRRAAQLEQEETGKLNGAPAETGCVFANRCPLAQDICRAERPKMIDRGDGHRSACHFAEKVEPVQYVEPTDGAAA